MFGKFAKIILGSAALLACLSLSSFAQAPRGLVQPLQGSELRTALAGKKLTPDPAVTQKAFDFSELFYADGRWMNYRRERALSRIEGTWVVSGGELCVKANDMENSLCRNVWISTNPYRIYMSDTQSPYRDILVFLVDDAR